VVLAAAVDVEPLESASVSSTSSDVNGLITYIDFDSAVIAALCLSCPSAMRRSISSLAHVRGK
jgi:hypothetical protein